MFANRTLKEKRYVDKIDRLIEDYFKISISEKDDNFFESDLPVKKSLLLKAFLFNFSIFKIHDVSINFQQFIPYAKLKFAYYPQDKANKIKSVLEKVDKKHALEDEETKLRDEYTENLMAFMNYSNNHPDLEKFLGSLLSSEITSINELMSFVNFTEEEKRIILSYK